MPALVSRGRGRRSINEINMVPFIDVMLVLLIIFMVTAPLITTGVVDLPSVGKSLQPAPVVLGQLVARVREHQRGQADTPVVISADKNVRYESVVKVMDTLQRAGVRRVGLSVKQGS
jgi:biopolymer transport protein TolR